MKLKLEREQAYALYDMLHYLLERYHPGNIAESLVGDLIKKTFFKLRKKLEEPTTKSYSLKLSQEEAKAYWIFFNQNAPEDGFIYEMNIARTHCNLIDQTYGQRTNSAASIGSAGIRKLDQRAS